jgi:hypothetical protein
MVLSRLTVGRWVITGGFFEIDHSLYRHPTAVFEAVWLGMRRLNGNAMTVLSAIGFIALLVCARKASHLLVVLSLAACVALPLYAFWNGHSFRIRYMVPLTMSLAVLVGLGVGLLPEFRPLAAICGRPDGRHRDATTLGAFSDGCKDRDDPKPSCHQQHGEGLPVDAGKQTSHLAAPSRASASMICRRPSMPMTK